jgi:hypothetical protein
MNAFEPSGRMLFLSSCRRIEGQAGWRMEKETFWFFST